MTTMEIPRPEDPLDAAIRYFGSQVALGRDIGYSGAAITNWKARKRMPKRAAVAVERATRGAVTTEELLAVYPDPSTR